MAHLIVNFSDGGRSAYPLETDLLSVGRHPECAIVIDDHTVSAHHAEIVTLGANFSIRDLKSRNGTKVNGKRIQETLLENGDSISFGEVQCSFVDLAAAKLLPTDDGASKQVPEPASSAPVLAHAGPPPLPRPRRPLWKHALRFVVWSIGLLALLAAYEVHNHPYVARLLGLSDYAKVAPPDFGPEGMDLFPTRLYFPSSVADFRIDPAKPETFAMNRLLLPAHVFDPIEGNAFLNGNPSHAVGLRQALLRLEKATADQDKKAFLALVHPEYRDMLQLSGATASGDFPGQISNLRPTELILVLKKNDCYAVVARTQGKGIVPLTYSKIGTEFFLTDRGHQVDLDTSSILDDLVHYFSTGVPAAEVLKVK